MSNITIHNFFIRSSFSSYGTSGWDLRGPNSVGGWHSRAKHRLHDELRLQ